MKRRTLERASPLRYPGGKAALADLIGDVITTNDMHDGVLAEPFAGGAGASIELLKREMVSHVVINDFDYRIFAFWTAAIRHTQRFIERVMTVPITMEEWHKARTIYRKCDRRRVFETGFATFFLNRCNRSGIISGGGPIGGHDQLGNYKLDARFNRITLCDRLRGLEKLSECITISNLDGLAFLRRPSALVKNAFVYIDPPYVKKGPELYLRAFNGSQHADLCRLLKNDTAFRWMLTYDDVPQVRDLYSGFRRSSLRIGYSAASRGAGNELLIFDHRLIITDRVLQHYRDGLNVRVGPLLPAA